MEGGTYTLQRCLRMHLKVGRASPIIPLTGAMQQDMVVEGNLVASQRVRLLPFSQAIREGRVGTAPGAIRGHRPRQGYIKTHPPLCEVLNRRLVGEAVLTPPQAKRNCNLEENPLQILVRHRLLVVHRHHPLRIPSLPFLLLSRRRKKLIVANLLLHLSGPFHLQSAHSRLKSSPHRIKHEVVHIIPPQLSRILYFAQRGDLIWRESIFQLTQRRIDQLRKL